MQTELAPHVQPSLATPLRILHLEDNPNDAELVMHELRRAGYDPIADRVETEPDYRDQLHLEPEIILADFTMPEFDALRALEIMQEGRFDIPFIIVSGTIGEERAVQAIQCGATDYIIKDRLGRLGQAVAQALEKKQLRDEKRRAGEQLQRHARFLKLTADVGMALASGKTLGEMLHQCAESMVCNLDAAFARIWTVTAGENVLELQASAGLDNHLDGPYSRVPFGKGEIGLIAQDRIPHLSNDVLNDPSVSDREWARREGMIAFAGFPIQLDDRLVGVVASFSRKRLSQDSFDAQAAVANQIAVGIERKRSEESLRRSNQTLHALIQTTPLAIITLGQDSNVTMWNSAAEVMFGWKESEVLGQPLPIVPPDQKEAFQKSIQYEFRPDKATPHELRLCHKAGTLVDVNLWTAPVTDAEDAIVGSLGLFVNITERKHLEATSRLAVEAVRQSEARKDAILRVSLDAIMTMDREGTILSFNPSAERIFGYLETEAIGKSMETLLIPPELPQEIKAAAYLMKAGKGFVLDKRVEMPGLRADGRRFPAELTITRVPLDGAPLFTGFLQDITDRKNLEEQFRQAQKMEAIGSLAAGVAHDFNNLLTIIVGYSAMIQTKLPLDDEIRSLVGEIGHAGERAGSLTRQLLAFSRKQVLEPKVLNLNAVVTDTAKMLQRLIGEDIDLNTVLAPDLGWVKADPGQLEQVLMNFAVNARDAMPKGGKLTIETANTELDETYTQAYPNLRPGLYVMMAVADTGMGMDEATKSRIFEPFFTTKEPGKGTGLGLATVFGIVKQSEGHVAVYSELGHGTTFKVYLPVVQALISSRKSLAGLKLTLQGTETILVAEDEPSLRKLARHVLQMHGYTVLDASNGEKALRVAEQHEGPIHLLVTDVVMPSMSGRQLAERLAAVRPDVKVLYVSGYTDDAVVRNGVLQAETAFLQKPFTVTALAHKVREALDAPE